MNYAEYILICQMANIEREIQMLNTEGRGCIEKVPEFLKYNESELNTVIAELQEKSKSLLKAIECLRSANIA